MNSPTLALRVAAVLFGLFCAGHVVRLVGRVEVVVANRPVPFWLSLIGAAAGAVLALWMCRVARSSQPPRAPTLPPAA